jgi:hypothetical protein
MENVPTSSAPTTGFVPAGRVNIVASDLLGTDGNGRSAPSASPQKTSPRMPLPASTVLGDLVNTVLERVAGWLNPNFVERSLGLARDFGQYAILGGAALTLLYAIFAAIKLNSFAMFMTGIGLIVALAIAQFAAVRFLGAGIRTIANTPSRVSSPAFLECVGLLVLLAAVGVLVGGIVTAIRMESFVTLLPALFISATLMYAGAIALHPKLVNIEMGEGTAGEEAIGLISFAFKTGLKLVPLFFLLLAVGGDLAILASFSERGQALASTVQSVLTYVPIPTEVGAGMASSTVVVLAALVPMAAYFAFLLGYLVIDCVRSVLCVPGKLDALRK